VRSVVPYLGARRHRSPANAPVTAQPYERLHRQYRAEVEDRPFLALDVFIVGLLAQVETEEDWICSKKRPVIQSQ